MSERTESEFHAWRDRPHEGHESTPSQHSVSERTESEFHAWRDRPHEGHESTPSRHSVSERTTAPNPRSAGAA